MICLQADGYCYLSFLHGNDHVFGVLSKSYSCATPMARSVYFPAVFGSNMVLFNIHSFRRRDRQKHHQAALLWKLYHVRLFEQSDFLGKIFQLLRKILLIQSCFFLRLKAFGEYEHNIIINHELYH